MPPTRGDFPFEVQVAFLLHDILPDRWDGMSGSYFGKDLAALGTLLDVWKVDDKQTVTYFLKNIEARYAMKLNKDLERQRKARENKGKNTHISSANIKKR